MKQVGSSSTAAHQQTQMPAGLWGAKKYPPNIFPSALIFLAISLSRFVEVSINGVSGKFCFLIDSEPASDRLVSKTRTSGIPEGYSGENILARGALALGI